MADRRPAPNPIVRFSPLLGLAWAALGAFLLYDATLTGMLVEWGLAAVCIILALGNLAIFVRSRRGPSRA